MRIQWSSEEAREMLVKLNRAAESLDDCNVDAGLVRAAIDDANVDGDDEALKAIDRRFEYCIQRLRVFSESLDDFIAALRKADEMFEDAERDNLRLMENLDSGSNASNGFIDDKQEYSVVWEPSAFAVMPNMRMNSVILPKWFEDLASNITTRPFI